MEVSGTYPGGRQGVPLRIFRRPPDGIRAPIGLQLMLAKINVGGEQNSQGSKKSHPDNEGRLSSLIARVLILTYDNKARRTVKRSG